MDLSILIPARNEIFLKRTIEDILSNIEGDTEIIAVLDGYWPDVEINEHERLTILHYEESIGQRAATNRAAKISTAKYLIKCDAHCAFDKGFDVKLMEDMVDSWTVVPLMRNLHAFDWVCKKCGNKRYQGPTPINCPDCDNTTDFEMDVVWIAKPSPRSTSYCFDTTLHFQYFGEFKKRPEGQKELSETLSLQGSCFMLTRDKYFELNICDEEWGSWGQQGVEVALKTWLSGGKVICNHKTWYAHLFRTQGGDFSFPYPQSGRAIEKVRKTSRDVFFNNKYEKQVKPLSWLIEKFKPVPYWHEPNGEEVLKEINEKGIEFYSEEKTLTKGIVYYTDNLLDSKILNLCQNKLLESTNDIPIINVSLKPLDFGTKNIVLPLERGYLTMFKQILRGLEELDTDIVFFCEHDVLYHPNHFEFIPEKEDIFYYNTNVWKVRLEDGHALHYDCQQTSGLCAYRKLLLEHYYKRVKIVEEIGFSRKMGFEPGTHRRNERVDDYRAESWVSEYPNIDIRHNTNLTPSRWKKEQFRHQIYTKGWTESDFIPGWGKSTEIITC